MAFALLAAFAYWASCPLPKNGGPVLVNVESGASTRQVGEILFEKKVIRSPFLFRVMARVLGADDKLQAGEYLFEPGIFVWDTIFSLVRGKTVYYSLTVREGLAVEEVATLIEERGFGSKERFLALARDASLVSEFVSPEELKDTRYPLEGYLFPDTYYIRKGMSEKEIIALMLRRFSQVFTKEMREKARSMKLSLHQVATLASLVEKEAVVDDERPIIAAVFLNRLRSGMKLDADPTVLYATGKLRGTPLYKDLQVDSPYNTYKYPGLPPGPISNFGKASLEAVLNPANVDYLYFVSRNDGTHAFSRTLSEHNKNVARYQGK
ncbi:MAG TPA: endolytic transglycosylase MltG [Firmicutes bacterium]|nr:endolytic transglycosylase MltG [Candidatus Fermentithermobacillaceae bacterium]